MMACIMCGVERHVCPRCRGIWYAYEENDNVHASIIDVMCSQCRDDLLVKQAALQVAR